ncbi:hypothetical protein CKM354_001232700 [Cercospora kikuchii]|uniref:Uncharacterized protein n=1 Tax=Cercospora kikuchii TaxID=84275 RepID=A0A9P3FLS0_9PEZI|nr:uncharacterized protein CKM354_001232700 [Cercospora kikuchii]GIZ49295.1 hypothetical protein CKM354_001232700 [Cercospora kikuchii]
MVDLHKFNEERRRKLRAMKVERAFARHQNGESDLEARVQNLERILRHARTARDEMADYFINSAVKPMLIANALVELPVELSGRAHKVDVSQGLKNTSPGPMEALSPEGLYMEARDELIELEETLERHELIWQKIETTCLMLFPHLTREHLTAYVQRKLQPVRPDLLEAQENFRKATEELARLGRDIPSMIELSSPTSTRGSQRHNSSRGSDSQSEGSRYERWLRKRKAAVRVKRDSINRWQLSSKPENYAMLSGTPPPDSALDDLPAKRSRPPTLSPEQRPRPAKRRKLKEYTAAQNDIRAAFAGSEPRYLRHMFRLREDLEFNLTIVKGSSDLAIERQESGNRRGL